MRWGGVYRLIKAHFPVTRTLTLISLLFPAATIVADCSMNSAQNSSVLPAESKRQSQVEQLKKFCCRRYFESVLSGRRARTRVD